MVSSRSVQRNASFSSVYSWHAGDTEQDKAQIKVS